MAEKKLYKLHMQLKDVKPVIWRRVLLDSKIALSELAYIIMTVFEMQASHLYSFTVPNAENFLRGNTGMSLEEFKKKRFFSRRPTDEVVTYGIPDEDELFDHEVLDATEYKLNNVLYAIGDRLTMQYDFGDGWEVAVTLEEMLQTEISAKELPRVLEGAGFGIVEDCGGPGGLMELAKAYEEKSGIEYRNYVEWLGMENFDITALDIDDLNFRLKKLPRIYREAYEDELEPTQRSIDLIERKYLRDEKL